MAKHRHYVIYLIARFIARLINVSRRERDLRNILRVNYPVAGLIRFYETSEIAFRNERRFEEKYECI